MSESERVQIMFGQKRKAITAARLDEAEARVRGLIKLYEHLDEQHRTASEANARLAGAIDELERRINNNQVTVNSAFAGLSRRVGSIAQDTLDAVEAIKQQIAAVPSAVVPPSVPPASQGPADGGLPSPEMNGRPYTADEKADLVANGHCPNCVGGELDTGWECNQCGFDAQGIAGSQRDAPMTSAEHMDALVVHGLTMGREQLDAEVLDRARADR